MPQRLIRSVLAGAVLLAAVVTGTAGAATGCAGPSSGGDWPSFGHDLSNTRTQSAEDKINASNVGSLAASWTFDVVADGCVYVATASGWIVALNAETGQLAWKSYHLANGSFGGMWSPSIVDGVLYEIVSVTGAPYVVALNDQTGEQLWASDPVATDAAVFSNAGAVVFDGLMFIGLSGAEGTHSRPGGYAIIDTTQQGKLLTRQYTVPDEDYARGYSGGSIWGTAVVDPKTQYLYDGTGQPSNTVPGYEHELTNAIVKIDVARARDADGNPVASTEITNRKFGKIVDAYKGLTEYGYPPADGDTECQLVLQTPANAACVKEDVDFGASPNLFTDARGKTLVGVFQKTGIYHAVYADTMERAWTNTMSQMVGPPFFASAASSAFDGKQIINVASFDGLMVAADRTTGAYNWVAPVVNGTNYHPTETANGVAFTTDLKRVLSAYDATSGLPVLEKPMSIDTVGGCLPGLSSSGAAIARHTVFAACGSWIVAYKLSA